MIDYLILSAELTLVALVVLACLRSAPAIWRLRTALVALLLTTLPWLLLPAIPIPVTHGSTAVLDALPMVIPLGTVDFVTAVVADAPPRALEIPLSVVLTAATALGLAAFAWLAFRQWSILRRWNDIARDGSHLMNRVPEKSRAKCRIRIVPDSDIATATGILRPTVWIGERYLDKDHGRGPLIHELVHVRRRHPQIASALTLIRCLCWWQPCVWLWVWLARRELEHDCDEVCAELLGRGDYRITLATLIREATDRSPGLALVGRRSFNLRRLRYLERLRTARVRHRLAAAVAIVLVPMLVLDFSVNAEDSPTLDDDAPPPFIEDSLVADSPMTIITADGKLSWVRLQTTGLRTVSMIAGSDPRHYYYHPDLHDWLDDSTVDIDWKVDSDTAGNSYDELIHLVAAELDLDARPESTAVLVAPKGGLADLGWLADAWIVAPPPNVQARVDFKLIVDGVKVPTVQLVVGRSNWTGFEAGGLRFDVFAQRFDDDGVTIELATPPRRDEPASHLTELGGVATTRSSFNLLVPYAPFKSYGDHSIVGPDGEKHSVYIETMAHPVDA
ncbi:MAG: M56 family metallopeptidase [Gammaproteobacteria bacterium]|nr:M56 family metallopeptidase [Gammaproteobacteria bacterium]